MIHIIITIDYEIFGNGNGDVKRHIIKPANNMLNIASSFKIPLTFMFEVNEFMFFEKYDNELTNQLGYSPAKIMKKQTIIAYQNGHDIQLHIHPQWLNAKYKNGKIIMKDSTISITTFSVEEIYKIIEISKKRLELLISNDNYKCIALRHTNLASWVEAPKKALEPMEKNGIKIHSLSTADHPKNKIGYWKLNNSNIFEIPIHSKVVKSYKIFTFPRIYALLYDRLNSSIFQKKHLNQKDNTTKKSGFEEKWDICKLTLREMIELLRFAMKRYDYENKEIPLVMIGHTKDFLNQRIFKRFLGIVKTKYSNLVKFNTFSGFLKFLNGDE